MVTFRREDDVKLNGYRKGIEAGVYAFLSKDGKLKTIKTLDCTNLTSHGVAWDVRDCDKIQVSFLIDPFTNEREEVEGEEPPAKKSHCDLSKCVIVGFVKNRGDSLGVLFKGKKGCVYWSHDVFNQITPHFNSITLALENKTKFYIKSDTEVDIKVTNVFGRMHVFLFDGEHTLTLNEAEWTQFTNSLPLMYIALRDNFIIEESVRFTIHALASGLVEEDVFAKADSQGHLCSTAHKLALEVALYKRWPNGCGSS
ncbi:hypothetical protein J6590_081415 [Homalodisca vitripennis]|nr:hypothetical protein J6590_081415 [Homalodisca vitripennis]